MWGARDADEDWHDTVPNGVKLKTSQSEVRRAFGLNNGRSDGNLFQGLENDAVEFGEVTRVFADQMLDGKVGEGSSSSIKTNKAKRGATKVAQHMHGMHRAAMGKGGWGKGGEVLSPINQPEMGVNAGSPCPSYGLDLNDFLITGATGHMWRRTVTISSQDGEELGTVKRGCPAWTNAFSWKVPEGHASGCRVGIDPTVETDGDKKCQQPEMEVLISPLSTYSPDCLPTYFPTHRQSITQTKARTTNLNPKP